MMPRRLFIRLFVRRGLRYLLVARGFIFVEALAVLAALSFLLTGSRIAAIDLWGNRGDIVAAMLMTAVTIALMRPFNQRVMTAIDRRFFREAYDAQRTLIGLSEVVRDLSDIEFLFEQVTDKISEALHPESIAVFLPDGATGDFVPAFWANHPRAVRPESGNAASLALRHYRSDERGGRRVRRRTAARARHRLKASISALAGGRSDRQFA